MTDVQTNPAVEPEASAVAVPTPSLSTELRLAGTDVPRSLAEQITLCDVLSRAQGVIPGYLYGKPASVLAIALAARALNLPLYQATQHLVPIEGRMSMSADMQRAIVRRQGARVRVVESTLERATVEVIRPDEPNAPYRVTYDIEDAQRANYIYPNPREGQPIMRTPKQGGNAYQVGVHGPWAGKDNWVNHTKAMLVARATTTVLRQACSDYLMGFIYTPDELADRYQEDAIDGRVIDTGGAEATAERVFEGRHVLPTEQAVELAVLIGKAANQEQLKALWDAQKADGLGEAWVDDERRVVDLVTARLAELNDAAAEPEPEPEASPTGPESVQDAPAQATLPCGCDVDIVFETGAHEPQCTDGKG